MKALNILTLLLFISFGIHSQVNITYTYKDGTKKEVTLKLIEKKDFKRLQIKKKDIIKNHIQAINISPTFANACVGETGYYIFPDGCLCSFREQPDTIYTPRKLHMPFYGIKTSQGAYAAIVKSSKYEFSYLASKKGKHFTFNQIYDFKNANPYEDIIIDYYKLPQEDADYSGMARVYRKYQLESGVVKPIKERVKKNQYLKYAASAMEIRIRQCWKPAPSPVKEQTLETEPPLNIRLTFDDVKNFIKDLKASGVDKAEICLVGWNIGGHDGRFPTHFPPEPALGGEEKLRSLIKYAQDNGYQIVCHTNSADTYRISPEWSEADVVKNPDGSLVKDYLLSGGQMYRLCYKPSYEKFVPTVNSKVADLGFKGLHFIDVLSCVPPRTCYDKKHPLNGKQAAKYAYLHLKDAAKKIGGVQSEGSFDHVANILDYIMYVTFQDVKNGAKTKGLVDCYVPIWNIVYNGIILNNSATCTINYAAKSIDEKMKLIEYGGRPTFYLYSAFKDNGANWMGIIDLNYKTKEDKEFALKAIKEGYDYLNKYSYLQYEFLDKHEKIADDVYLSTYSNGDKAICNYSYKDFIYDNKTVKARDFLIISNSQK